MHAQCSHAHQDPLSGKWCKLMKCASSNFHLTLRVFRVASSSGQQEEEEEDGQAQGGGGGGGRGRSSLLGRGHGLSFLPPFCVSLVLGWGFDWSTTRAQKPGPPIYIGNGCKGQAAKARMRGLQAARRDDCKICILVHIVAQWNEMALLFGLTAKTRNSTKRQNHPLLNVDAREHRAPFVRAGDGEWRVLRKQRERERRGGEEEEKQNSNITDGESESIFTLSTPHLHATCTS